MDMKKIFLLFWLVIIFISDTFPISRTIIPNKYFINFGSISYNSGSKYDTLQLSNKGDSPITITSTYFIKYPTIFTVTLNNAPPNRTLLPSTLTGPLNIGVAASSYQIIGYYEDTLVIVNNSDNAPILKIPVSFTVDPVNRPYTWDKSNIDFGRVYEGTSTVYDTVIFKTSALMGLDILEIKFLSPNSLFNIFINNAPPVCSLFFEKPFKIGISFTPKIFGTFIDTLCVKTSSIPTFVYIPVKIVVDTLRSFIQPDKREIDFGSLGYESDFKEEVININNISQVKDAIFTQAIFENNNNYFVVTNQFPYIIPRNSSGQIFIRFYPSETGNLRNTLSLINNSMNEPNLQISLLGNVISSEISVTPENINFGNVAINSSPIDTTFIIKNVGKYKLKINNFSEYNNDTIIKVAQPLLKPVILNSGETINLTVRLNPLSLGSKNDSILINNNSSNAPNKTVKVFANVTNPNLSILPQELNFGTTKLDTPSKILPLYFLNNGNSIIIINNLTIFDDTISFKILKNLNSNSLQPGKLDSLLIEFYPRQLGAKRGRLLISCNDPLGNLRQINLSGTGGGKPILYVDKKSIDFGEITAQASKDTTIIISNEGNINLVVSSKSFTGNNKSMFTFISGGLPVELIKNQNEIIKIRITGQLPIGNKVAQLNFASNDPEKPSYSIDLSAVVKSPTINRSPERILFDTLNIGSSKDTTIIVNNFGNSNLIINNMYLDGAFASDFVLDNYNYPITILPGGSFNIKVKFKPIEPGLRYARLVILNNDPTNSEVSTILIGNARVLNQPAIGLSIQSIDFGKILINTKKDTIITISSVGTEKLIIDSINILGSFSNYYTITHNALPIELEAGKFTEIKLSFSPTLTDTTKIYLAEIRIKCNDPKRQTTILPITGGGYIETGTITYRPQKIVFDSIPLFGFKDTSIIIENTGITKKVVDSINLIGEDKSHFLVLTSFPFSIEPKSKKEIYIRFNPSDANLQKLYTAILRIKTDDLVNNLLTVELFGTAKQTQSSLFVSTNKIDFGKVAYLLTEEKSFTIKNIGTSTITIKDIFIWGSDSSYFKIVDPTNYPLNLASFQEINIKLRFLANAIGIKNSVLTINSNDIFNPTYNINLSGETISPKVSILRSINFGNLKTKHQKDSVVIIKNVGDGILNIFDIKKTGTDTSSFVILAYTNKISPSQSDSFVFSFAPKSIGNKSAVIEIYSNDISNPITSITLTGRGVEPKININPNILSLGDVYIGKRKDTSLSIFNSGEADLIINDISIIGSDSNVFNVFGFTLPIIIKPSEIKNIFISSYSSSIGIKNANIRILSDDPNYSTTLIPLTVNYKTITKLVNETQDFIAIKNQEKSVAFSISDKRLVPSEVRIFYRLGGNSKFDSATVPGSNSKYEYTFDRTLITDRGLDYYFKVYIDGTIATLPDSNYIEHPLCLRVKIPQENFPKKLLSGIYFNFAIPFELEQSSFSSEIFRNFGKSDPFKWRLLRWENNNYVELTEKNIFDVPAGYGFWVISSKEREINFNNILTNLTNVDFKIKLMPGWNQIGNPFMFPIDIKNVIIPKGKNVETIFWKWNGKNYEIESLTLQPFEGYFIINNEETPVDISIKPIISNLTQISNNISDLHDLSKGKIDFILKDESEASDIITIQNHSQQLKNISKPPIFPYSNIDMRITDNNGEYALFNKDISTQDASIVISLNNLKKNNNYSLLYSKSGNLPENISVTIIDLLSGETHRINENEIKFKAESTNKLFKILIKNKDTKEENLNKISEYKLLQNYPNPFNPTTKIDYHLKKDEHVKLIVYNQIGQEVATLVDSYQKTGKHSIIWNAEKNPSGVYYYILYTGNCTITRKMILLK